MKHAVVHTKDDLRIKLLNNRSQIESYGVLQLGVMGLKNNEEIPESHEINLLVHFQPDRKTFDNFMDLTFLLEEITGRNVKVITTESLTEISNHRVLNEVDYIISS